MSVEETRRVKPTNRTYALEVLCATIPRTLAAAAQHRSRHTTYCAGMVDEGGTAAGAHDIEKNANGVGGGQEI